MLMSPFYLGVGGIIQIVIIEYLYPTQVNTQFYQQSDIKYFAVLCLAQIGVQFFMVRANFYYESSSMAPILYLENIFTLLTDILIFHYRFVMTDIIGIIIIALGLVIPLIVKYKKIHK